MNLEQARTYAKEVVVLLSGGCERIEIAGGVRRQKSDPHDIEIVAKPRLSMIGFRNLLDELRYTEVQKNHLEILVEDLIGDGTFSYGEMVTQHRNGKEFKIKAPYNAKYKRLKYKGEQLDLFAVIQPAEWGVIFTLRTGDAGYSHWLVSQGWPYGLHFDHGSIHRVTRKSDGALLTTPYTKPDEHWAAEHLSTPEEKDVFDLLKIPYLSPEKRNNEEMMLV